ncbi:MAG: hypothetical protein U0835_26245 [Isosphaeraceae bacterium]
MSSDDSIASAINAYEFPSTPASSFVEKSAPLIASPVSAARIARRTAVAPRSAGISGSGMSLGRRTSWVTSGRAP